MGIIRILKLALFIYECIRIMVLAVHVLLQPLDPAGLPLLVYAVQGVLFPLMAMFIWLNISRYRAYLPLFAAGKFIGILTLALWLIVTRHYAVPVFSGIIGTELLLLCGDILAISAVLLIIRNDSKTNEIQAEENQCELFQ